MIGTSQLNQAGMNLCLSSATVRVSVTNYYKSQWMISFPEIPLGILSDKGTDQYMWYLCKACYNSDLPTCMFYLHFSKCSKSYHCFKAPIMNLCDVILKNIVNY